MTDKLIVDRIHRISLAHRNMVLRTRHQLRSRNNRLQMGLRYLGHRLPHRLRSSILAHVAQHGKGRSTRLDSQIRERTQLERINLLLRRSIRRRRYPSHRHWTLAVLAVVQFILLPSRAVEVPDDHLFLGLWHHSHVYLFYLGGQSRTSDFHPLAFDEGQNCHFHFCHGCCYLLWLQCLVRLLLQYAHRGFQHQCPRCSTSTPSVQHSGVWSLVL
jgi:hypothetical protein